jgi:hypothetical protein
MGKWQATINSDGKRIHLGSFGTLEAATAARVEAEIAYKVCRQFPKDHQFSPDDWRYLFFYDESLGRLINAVYRPNGARLGAFADESTADGYRIVTIQGKHLRAHRIIWEYCYEQIPLGLEIDHRNRDRADNRIQNFRLVDSHGNNLNLGPRENSSGFTGVVFNKKDDRWQAQIGFKGKHVYLGQFKDKSTAIAARKQAEQEYGFGE